MTENLYDRAPYPRHAYGFTHPGRMAAMATLAGLEPPPIENCRVLELGCASGSNLIPMAYGLPDARFIGLDLSRRQIAEGREFIAAVGLTNIRLEHADLRTIGEEVGQFDYIIAHGVHSWAPRDVQTAIVRLCARLLAENGAALVSYNAYPGCHLRQMVRGMAQFHVRDIDDLDERADQLVALVRFLAGSLGDEYKVYRQILASECERLAELDRAFILHDVLEDDNLPVYFHEFVAQAAEHGLQYLGEAIPLDRRRTGVSDATLAELRAKYDLIEYEQHLDFLEGTAFRRTLVCRQGQSLHHDPSRGDWRRLLVASQAVAEFVKIPAPKGHAPEFSRIQLQELASDRPMEFVAAKGKLSAAIRCDRPIAKAALWLLGSSYPLAMPFEELLAKSAAMLNRAATNEDAAEIRAVVLGGLSIGATELHRWQPQLAAEPSGFPEASPIARYQIARGWEPTTMWHDRLALADSLARQLVLCLDGRHDRAAIAAEIGVTGAEFASRLESALKDLARTGVMIA